ncbi:histidinol dehydrogenase [Arenimonas caeni]|jgi:histidinol dehydrogenase|uniref:histidinol dehydrogenase n=1 Tax=Arenimonas caeni TaxID=2058085 RepID=UPI002A3726A0|nr:histidinol dehydrogenase [Arenimonas caeni]MDY0022729.1 histidinol dehydrogenase [Arenimonas caeni]
MKTIDWSALDAGARAAALARPGGEDQAGIEAAVKRVFEQVQADGDTALRALTRRFDGVELGAFEVTAEEFAEAEAAVTPALRAAMVEARGRLLAWHRAGAGQGFEIETAPGVSCGRVLRPIARVGLYVPAGSAPLPSTALMLGVPAEVAGCPDVVLCTPPRADGRADPAVLVAAALCGIRRVFKLGGAQAIAAMALGTGSVPRCDKLFGPGNRYVTAAKQLAAMTAGGPAIDMPAGPSEVLVIADAGAPPVHVAADLLSQAEHGPDSQVVLATDSAGLIEAVRTEVERQLAELPRAGIACQALEHARLVKVGTLDEAFALSNEYAPEHLILALREPRAWLDRVTSAGSVFLGDFAPEGLGDYCSGTNHVLPTNGAARAWSGVGVASFQKAISFQQVSREGLAAIGPCAVEMARAEGLEAHAQSVLRRLGDAA